MKAVLLAAGEGVRLRPLTLSTPKCLVPIKGKPLLDYWLEMLLYKQEISEIFINVCYLKSHVIKHIKTKWGDQNKIKIWHESHLLGTAGTLLHNMGSIEGNDVMVIHADNLSVFNLNEFLHCHKTRDLHIKMTMMLFETDCPSQCGIVEMNQNNEIVNMHEKVLNPPGNLANGAVYIFSKNVLEWIKEHSALDISNDVIPAFLNKIVGWKNDVYHRDIGTPTSYKLANHSDIPE